MKKKTKKIWKKRFSTTLIPVYVYLSPSPCVLKSPIITPTCKLKKSSNVSFFFKHLKKLDQDWDFSKVNFIIQSTIIQANFTFVLYGFLCEAKFIIFLCFFTNNILLYFINIQVWTECMHIIMKYTGNCVT